MHYRAVGAVASGVPCGVGVLVCALLVWHETGCSTRFGTGRYRGAMGGCSFRGVITDRDFGRARTRPT